MRRTKRSFRGNEMKDDGGGSAKERLSFQRFLLNTLSFQPLLSRSQR